MDVKIREIYIESKEELSGNISGDMNIAYSHFNLSLCRHIICRGIVGGRGNHRHTCRVDCHVTVTNINPRAIKRNYRGTSSDASPSEKRRGFIHVEAPSKAC